MHTRKLAIAAFALVVILALGWAAVNWRSGSETAELAKQQIFQPATDGYRARELARSQPRGLFEKARPAWVLYGISGMPGENQQAVSQRLQQAAEAAGWSIDQACAEEFLWCAKRTGESGQVIFLTVATLERSSKDTSQLARDGELLLVRLQYL